MYNRYVPQPDGSYCRSRHPDKEPPKPPAPPCPPEPQMCCEEPASPQPPKKPPCPPPRPQKPNRPQPSKCEHSEPCGLGIGNFLRQLFPRNFDTGDLIVILLLLLMSSDCQEDQNTALLTLALYLFL